MSGDDCSYVFYCSMSAAVEGDIAFKSCCVFIYFVHSIFFLVNLRAVLSIHALAWQCVYCSLLRSDGSPVSKLLLHASHVALPT